MTSCFFNTKAKYKRKPNRTARTPSTYHVKRSTLLAIYYNSYRIEELVHSLLCEIMVGFHLWRLVPHTFQLLCKCTYMFQLLLFYYWSTILLAAFLTPQLLAPLSISKSWNFMHSYIFDLISTRLVLQNFNDICLATLACTPLSYTQLSNSEMTPKKVTHFHLQIHAVYFISNVAKMRLVLNFSIFRVVAYFRCLASLKIIVIA